MFSDALLKRTLAFTGLTFSTFLALHINGHTLAIISPQLANWSLLKFRRIYQNPFAEVMFAVSVAVHVGAGAGLFWKRFERERERERRRKEVGEDVPETDEGVKKDDGERRGGWARYFGSVTFPLTLHRVAGQATILMLAAHVAATRIAPLLYLKVPSRTDLTLVTFGLDTSRHPMFASLLHIFYVTFSAGSMYHMVYGMVRSVDILNLRQYITPPRMVTAKWNAIALSILGLMTVTVLAIGGWIHKIDIPKRDMYFEMEHFLWSLPLRVLQLDFSFLWGPRH